jgi:hypothetical protein
MAKGQTPALTPEQAERYREVVRLRALGLTFEEIAERTGYADRSSAKNAYEAALRRYGREAVGDLRELEGFRLEELWRRLMAKFQNPDQLTVPEFAQLVSAGVRISQRRAALYGMDAPRQVELSGVDGGPVQTDVGELLRQRLLALKDADSALPEGQVIDVDSDN